MRCSNPVAKLPSMNDTVIAQLHRTLVDALRRSRAGALDRPVTVAEIYQDLLPYRTARAEIGFEMNADYEHALLRLLAGEGDYARIEPREVRDKLRMELDSPNPNVGLFRSYAACDVWVSIDDEDEAAPQAAAAAAPVEPSWEAEFVGNDDVEDDEDAFDIEPEPVSAPETHAASARFEIAADQPAEEAERERDARSHEDVRAGACGFCGAELPSDRMVNFCPYCGTDQSQQPCPACGELLDPLWRFCVSCGTRVRPLGDHVN